MYDFITLLMYNLLCFLHDQVCIFYYVFLLCSVFGYVFDYL